MTNVLALPQAAVTGRFRMSLLLLLLLRRRSNPRNELLRQKKKRKKEGKKMGALIFAFESRVSMFFVSADYFFFLAGACLTFSPNKKKKIVQVSFVASFSLSFSLSHVFGDQLLRTTKETMPHSLSVFCDPHPYHFVRTHSKL